MDASLMNARALRLRVSKSLANRRHRLSQAKVRSTTQRLGRTSKPCAVSERLTISTANPGNSLAEAGTEFRPLVTAVSEQLFQEGEQPEQGRQNQYPAVALLNVGRMNHRMHQQTLGIHHDMPLLAVDLLARIITRRIDVGAAFFGAFNALAVDDAGSDSLADRPVRGISGEAS